MSRVRIEKLEAFDALYCRFPTQTERQPCRLNFNPDLGLMWCDYAPSIGGGTTAERFHGMILYVEIPCINADAANRLMEEAAGLAETVMDGWRSFWNGSNLVGQLNASAQAAFGEIERLCAEENFAEGDYLMPEQISAPEWFVDGPTGVTADTTDAELRSMVEVEVGFALREANGLLLDHDDVLQYLTAARDKARETVREELSKLARDVVMLRNRHDDQLARIYRWKAVRDGQLVDSLRELGALVGMSHPHIARIIEAEEYVDDFEAAAAAKNVPAEVGTRHHGRKWRAVNLHSGGMVPPDEAAGWAACGSTPEEARQYISDFERAAAATFTPAGVDVRRLGAKWYGINVQSGFKVPAADAAAWAADRFTPEDALTHINAGRTLVDATALAAKRSPAGKPEVRGGEVA